MSWDDGKHTKVKKVKLTFDDVINSIEVEYDGTNLKSQPRGTIGTKSDGFTLSSDEYITEVNGYYKTVFSGEVITELSFKTNKKTYGPYGNKTRNYFSVNAPKDNHIVGFLGTSGNALNSIDVHFAHVPSAGNPGITPGGDGTTPKGPETIPGPSTTPETTPGGPSTTPGGPGTTPGGPSTTPETTPGGPGTTPGGPSSTPETTPGGPSSNTPGSTSEGDGSTLGGPETTPGGGGSNNDSNPQKLEVQGGKGGNQWDDGANHDGVTKIHIEVGAYGIEQIKFDYYKNGETKEGASHGVKSGRGSLRVVEINHPNEYLVSVKGSYDSTNVIQIIQFITISKSSESFGCDYTGDGKEFSLQVKDKKIIGFHGFADSHLNSLGAYFAPITSTPLKPSKKLKAIGGDDGALWDDGVFDDVRKVHVGQYHEGVSFVKIEYNKGSQVIIKDGHGKESMLGTETFELDYPSEYITALQGYYDKVQGEKGGVKLVTSLIFVTNKQTSYPYGLAGGEFFEIKEEGHKIVGFHGKAGDYVHQIGVYVAPITN